MALAYVLITTRPSKEMDVYTQLKQIKEITDLHPLFGEYDLIAKVDTETFNGIGYVVVDKIRIIDGVKDTKTLTGTSF